MIHASCIHPFTMGGYQYISINIVGDIECWVMGGGGTTQKFGTEAAVDAATNFYFIVGGRSILHEGSSLWKALTN
jgi:hypothetical protein